MKIHTRYVCQMNDDGTFTELSDECKSYEYTGPVALAFGGRSSTSSTQTSTQQITTLGDVSGPAIFSEGGNVNIQQEVTDLGAVQGAFDLAGGALDFSGETVQEAFGFGESAFDFANDIARQAGETSQQAIATSQRAIATVATGGGSDLAATNSRTIVLVVVGLAAIILLPQILKRRA